MKYAEVRRFDETQFGKVTYMGDAVFVPKFDIYGLFAVSTEGLDPQPVAGWFYDKGTNTFTETKPPGAVVPKETLTAPQFWLKKFDSTERAKVWGVCNGESVPGVTISLTERYRLAAFRDISIGGEPIPLHAAETEAVVNGMESAGIIGAGRAAEILS